MFSSIDIEKSVDKEELDLAPIKIRKIDEIGLSSLQETLKSLLNGTAPARLYLASLDPGVGKTTRVCRVLADWKANGFIPNAGVLIGVSRVNEIDAYIKGAGLDEADYAILTSDKFLDKAGIGKKRAAEARILFTTQQMIDQRGDRLSFNSTECFLFKGKVRELKVWDESLIPAINITIRLDELKALAAPLRANHPGLVGAIESLIFDAYAADISKHFLIPDDLPALIMPVLHKKDWARLRQEQANVLRSLQRLAGRSVLLTNDNIGDRVISGCSLPLRADFAPAVILDASARVRSTYGLMEKSGWAVERLPAQTWDYSKLHVSLFKQACGKTTMKNPAKRVAVAKAVADVINGSGNEPWLVLHYKDGITTLAGDIAKLISRPERVSYLHWGAHRATNEYRHIKNVMVVGGLSYSDAGYKALYMAASGQPAEAVDEDAWRELERPELMHNLLQGVCRGNARNGESGLCGESNVYLILTPRGDMTDLVRATFPGCKLVEWNPIPAKLSGRTKMVADEVLRRFETAGVDEVPFSEISGTLGLSTHYLSKIKKRTDFVDFVSSVGLSQRGRAFIRFDNTISEPEQDEYEISVVKRMQVVRDNILKARLEMGLSSDLKDMGKVK